MNPESTCTCVFNWPKKCPYCGSTFINHFTPANQADPELMYFQCDELGCKRSWSQKLEIPSKKRLILLVVVGDQDGGPGLVTVEPDGDFPISPQAITEQLTLQLHKKFGDKPVVVFDIEDVINKGNEYTAILNETNDKESARPVSSLLSAAAQLSTGKKPFIYRKGHDDGIKLPNMLPNTDNTAGSE